ncbi:hypothetical protein [Achromobacter sp. DH1f]|uniref:hypothetical protein n=1 Tax=Achromobacter sp. DH1f TaxID=1397275 RepID=UPI00046A99A5|nr:hypothetical protein [Achromobacter sp. DH1f]
MTTPFYLDAVSLINTFEGGGVKGLDAIGAWANARGLEMVVADLVIFELDKPGSSGASPELTSWIERNAKTVTTNEYKLFAQYVEDSRAGIPNNYVPKDKGERAIVELLDQLSPDERAKATVFSEDGYFRNNVKYKDFTYGPSEVLSQAAAKKLISMDDYVQLRDGFRQNNTYNPLKKNGGYSKALDKFVDPSDISSYQKGGAGAISVRTLKIITKGAAMLGGAAMVFDIGTSTAQAAQELGKGNPGEATHIMLQLGARLYASTQGALLGARLGVQGGLVFGLPGALLGALVGAVGGGMAGDAAAGLTVDKLWAAAGKLLGLLQNNEYIKEPEFPGSLPFLSDEKEYRRELATSGMPQDLIDQVVDSIKKGGELVDIQSLRHEVDNAKNQPGSEQQLVKVTQYQIDDWQNVTVIEGDREITKIYNNKVEVTKYSESNQADPTWVYQEKWARQEFVGQDGKTVVSREHFLDGILPKEVAHEYRAVPPEDVTPERYAQIQRELKDYQARVEELARKKAQEKSLTIPEMLAELGWPQVPATEPSAPVGGTSTHPAGELPPYPGPPFHPWPGYYHFMDGNWYYSGPPPQAWDAWVCVDGFCGPAPYEMGSPIVLDLDRNAMLDIVPTGERSYLVRSAATFDFNADGLPDKTAWVGPKDGFLIIDLNKDGSFNPDGVVDQTKELAFTAWKTQEQWKQELLAQGLNADKPVTDMLALRLLFDANQDGILDARDPYWDSFRVWQDKNQNGISDAGELTTLDQAGIQSISLAPTPQGAMVFPDGSAITGTSQVQMADGSHMLAGDVSLRYLPSGGPKSS